MKDEAIYLAALTVTRDSLMRHFRDLNDYQFSDRIVADRIKDVPMPDEYVVVEALFDATQTSAAFQSINDSTAVILPVVLELFNEWMTRYQEEEDGTIWKPRKLVAGAVTPMSIDLTFSNMNNLMIEASKFRANPDTFEPPAFHWFESAWRMLAPFWCVLNYHTKHFSRRA
jgi:hypothetical protein